MDTILKNEITKTKLKPVNRLNKSKKEGELARISKQTQHDKSIVSVQISMKKSHLDRGDTTRRSEIKTKGKELLLPIEKEHLKPKRILTESTTVKPKLPMRSFTSPDNCKLRELLSPESRKRQVKTRKCKDIEENRKPQISLENRRSKELRHWKDVPSEKHKLLSSKAKEEYKDKIKKEVSPIKEELEKRKLKDVLEKKKITPKVTKQVKNVNDADTNNYLVERSKLILNAAIKKLINEDNPSSGTKIVDLNENRQMLKDKYAFGTKLNDLSMLIDGSNNKKKAKLKIIEQMNEEFGIGNGKSEPTLFEIETIKEKEKFNDSSIDSGISDIDKEADMFRKPIVKIRTQKEADAERKPIVKTITSENARTYKAVTFVEEKKKSTQLLINMQRKNKRSILLNDRIKEASRTSVIERSEKLANASKLNVSKTSIEEKTNRRAEQERRSSSNVSVARTPSATEISKWAPTSISHHTKPYYDAWVDTTLTSRSKDEELHREIIKSIQKSILERPSTPELVYGDINDETYTGRIKVSHR